MKCLIPVETPLKLLLQHSEIVTHKTQKALQEVTTNETSNDGNKNLQENPKKQQLHSRITLTTI